MFDALLDIRNGGSRTRAGAAVSVLAHAAVIVAAVGATRALLATAEPEPPEIVQTWRAEAQPEPPTRPSSPQLPAAPIHAPVLIAPVEIPTTLPAIDFAARPTRDDDVFAGVRTADVGRSDGPSGALGSGSGSSVHDWRTVEKPAMQIAGAGAPEYPEMLRQAGVDGEVVASFVVDTAGRAEIATLRILRATRHEFADAVRRALPRARFLPAEAAGRRVRQLVELPFVFSIQK
ncbi:MAG TPA: TonB family protein [Gemmatimonadaceae bacterium]|nr:TonB family protein [Gemmatimonadaceae bacterium]